MNMRAIIAGTEPFKLRLYSGHDGSMIRLASGLGLGKPESDGRLRWPALGGEIIFEVGANRECKCDTEQNCVGLEALREAREGPVVRASHA